VVSTSEVLLNQRIRDQFTTASCAVGIFSKVPKAGVSKSRLCPPLRPGECAELSRCFLKDTAENVSKLARETDKVVAVGACVTLPKPCSRLGSALSVLLSR
jgi:glycosyltransferase A (GT-A) superfamily protein (DUF2064 family)